MKPDPFVLVITEDTCFGPGSTLPEGVSRIVLGPGGSLHGQRQASSLRALGYTDDEVNTLFDEAASLLARSRAESVSLPTLPMSAVQALDRAIAQAFGNHITEPAWTTEQMRLNEQMRWYAQRGTDKALQVFVNERLHSRYRDVLPDEPVVDVDAYRRRRAKRKSRARIAKQSRLRNRR